METNNLTKSKGLSDNKNNKRNNGHSTIKFTNQKVESQLIKVTPEEIAAIRPSVYKYLLP